jgi:hypothetical protein
VNSLLAATKEQHALKATTLCKHIDYRVTCIMALEAMKDVTDRLLLTPEEHAILNQSASVLEVNRDHYTKIIERLATYG